MLQGTSCGHRYTAGPAPPASEEQSSRDRRSSRQSIEGYHGWELLRRALADREGQTFAAPAVILQSERDESHVFRIAFEADSRFSAEEVRAEQEPSAILPSLLTLLLHLPTPHRCCYYCSPCPLPLFPYLVCIPLLPLSHSFPFFSLPLLPLPLLLPPRAPSTRTR